MALYEEGCCLVPAGAAAMLVSVVTGAQQSPGTRCRERAAPACDSWCTAVRVGGCSDGWAV